MSPDEGLDTSLPALAALEGKLSLRIVLAALAAAFFLIAWNRGITLLYGSFALVLATIAIAAIAPRLNLAGLSASRRAPREASVGGTARLSLTLETRGWPRRYMLEIVERLPFAPGREVLVFIPHVDRATRVEYDVSCTLRGRYRLENVAVATGFPLGMARAARELHCNSSSRALELTVYPRIVPVGGLSVRRAVGGDGSRPVVARGRDVFRETRPYRHGDSMRDIHWRVSARTGELVVKEFDQVDAENLLLILDLDPRVHEGRDERHSFEYAVEIAASIAAWAIARGQAIGLAGGLDATGFPRLWIPPGRGHSALRALLKALVDVRADCRVPYSAVLQSVAATGCGAQRVAFVHWRGTVPPEGSASRTWPTSPPEVMIEFDGDSFRSGRAARPGFSKNGIYRVTAGTDLAALLG